ncbi:aminomethyl transferase family protein [Amycolatopsis rhabdoformis]|uniref:Aminomethyl transferase family protein n=1 Tax=Amycolatopsis rhabdoformis TaxID=1448059 RepID=A0ABZ1IK43_9PSEU|nr:aminomethyl transferase family protein [Amycolatopsis rhabdoformis]WSE34131.1 aminomethyl transferase family protein [Amycolatopsis rhabdoformis]
MSESLEAKIRRSGGPVPMLRAAPGGAYPFPIRSEYTNWRDEQASWKETAVLFDQSHHMLDVTFTGPDAKRLMSDYGVNSFATFGADRAKQYVAVREDGYLVGDAILFGLEDDKVSLVGGSVVHDWITFQAERGGYRVDITRDERTPLNPRRSLYRYQLQGPAALKIAEKAHGGTIDRLKFFRMGRFTVAGHTVRALNHTMTGVPGLEMTGLELFGPLDEGAAVLEALVRAGEEFGMRQGGAIAYSTTALESGWIGLPVPAVYSGECTRAFREWLPANSATGTASLGGSFDSPDIEDYYPTPWDLGYGGIVKFDHDFLGRSALEKAAGQPHRRKVWLRWNDEDVARLLAGGLSGRGARTRYLQVPYAVYATFQYDTVRIGDRVTGISNRTGYTVNVGGWSSLAMIDEADAVEGAEVTVVWGEPDGGAAKANVERHVQTEVRAIVSTTPLA